MKKILQCFIVMLCMSFLSTNAQVKVNNGPVLTLKPGSVTELMPDSINVDLYIENVSGIYGRKRLFVKPKNGSFIINLPQIGHLSRLKFYFKYGETSSISNFYFVEPTDNVEILFTRNYNLAKNKYEQILLNFSGKGASKYAVADIMAIRFSNLQKEVKSLENKLQILTVSNYQSSYFTSFCEKLYETISLYQKKNREILKNSKKNIGANLVEFYNYELDGGSEFFQRILFGYYSRAKTENDKQVISNVHFKKKILLEYNKEHPWIKYSAIYVINEGFCKMLDTYYQHHGEKYAFKDQYNNLKEVKVLGLRERLLTELFLFPPLQLFVDNFETKDSCLVDAFSVVKSPILKAALNEQLLFSKGSIVYPFSLPDTAGKVVSLHSMRGKVFMLDFYGEGCSGCAIFGKRFKDEVYPEFANNPNFQVISVSVDKTKDRWYKAMNSGLYTQKNVYINLNLGKDGMNHPMLKYYKVNAVPFLLLVDKNGKLIARLNGMGSAAISAAIRKSLNEDS